VQLMGLEVDVCKGW